MNVIQQTRTAIAMVVVVTLLTGLVYPLTITALAQWLFPAQAGGSLVVGRNGAVIGSRLIGQKFVGPGYFHPRPSAAGKHGYDPLSSGGSNLAPTNKNLIHEVQARAVAYRKENGLAPNAPVPVDAVTASGSGLDPDISPANALLQVPRVAKARGMTSDLVRALVERHIHGPTMGILGSPSVNVLELNLAMDHAAGRGR